MEYKHFSHQHPLNLYKIQTGQQFQCNGCNLPCHDSVFACWNCNFFLREHCGNANRYVKHPSHLLHPLVLVPSPTYCSGSFLCNGCGAPGSTFSYCCPLCEVDLHIHCTYLPKKITCQNTHPHELYLSFQLPDNIGSAQSCKICCKELSSKYWYYFCEKQECDFRVHTFCATSEVKLGQYRDDEPEDLTNPSACVYPPQAAAATAVTAPTSEEVIAEMFQMQMQLQMNQQIAQIFASRKI